jgi:transposase
MCVRHSPAQAAAEATSRARSALDMGVVARALFGAVGPINVSAVPELEAMTADVRPAVLVLLAAVALLLITATANVASLQLAPATTRRRKMVADRHRAAPTEADVAVTLRRDFPEKKEWGVTVIPARDAIRDITRFDRVQEFASYARLVKCKKQSGGKTLGTGGAKMGNVHLKWAFSEAAVLFLRHTEGKKLIARIEKQHGKGKALSILAHKIGRAVFYMLSRGTVFSMEKFLAA